MHWQIEVLFKLWKQHGKLDESRRQQGPRVLIELYAKFMALLIQHWLLLAGCWQQADRSLVKAARVVRAWAERIVRAMTDTQRLEALLSELMAALARAGRQTRRKKQAATWQLLGGNLLLNLMRMGHRPGAEVRCPLAGAGVGPPAEKEVF